MSIKNDLINIRVWAQDKIDAGQEPPWAWYQYMKLIEVTDTILTSMGSISKQQTQPDTSKEPTMPM